MTSSVQDAIPVEDRVETIASSSNEKKQIIVNSFRSDPTSFQQLKNLIFILRHFFSIILFNFLVAYYFFMYHLKLESSVVEIEFIKICF